VVDAQAASSSAASGTSQRSSDPFMSDLNSVACGK
jgi:hypothetical protein